MGKLLTAYLSWTSCEAHVASEPVFILFSMQLLCQEGSWTQTQPQLGCAQTCLGPGTNMKAG